MDVIQKIIHDRGKGGGFVYHLVVKSLWFEPAILWDIPEWSVLNNQVNPHLQNHLSYLHEIF